MNLSQFFQLLGIEDQSQESIDTCSCSCKKTHQASLSKPHQLRQYGKCHRKSLLQEGIHTLALFDVQLRVFAREAVCCFGACCDISSKNVIGSVYIQGHLGISGGACIVLLKIRLSAPARVAPACKGIGDASQEIRLSCSIRAYTRVIPSVRS